MSAIWFLPLAALVAAACIATATAIAVAGRTRALLRAVDDLATVRLDLVAAVGEVEGARRGGSGPAGPL